MSQLPPGTRSRLWTTLQIMRRPDPTFAALQARYGDTFTVRAMNGTVVCTCSPEGAREVFATRAEDTRPFAVEALVPLTGRHAVIVLHGAAHTRERRVLSPAFHGPRMRAFGEEVQRVARERIAGWRAGEVRVLQDEMLEITLRVIVRAVFGVREDPARWLEAVRALVATVHPAFLFFRRLQQPWLPQWKRFVAARDALDRLIHAEIADRRASGERGSDVLSLLLDSTWDDGAPMPDAAIRDELVTLLFAGHETTSIALAWAVSRLHTEPEAGAWLREGLARVGQGPLEVEGCPELGAFCKEVLRLDVIVPDVLRVLEKPMVLGGWEVPAGVSVGVLLQRIHQSEALYPEPARFRPQRFVERRYAPHEFMPFGGGLRRCVGAALATYEMELVLAEIVRHATLEPASRDVARRRNVVMAPSEGVRMRVV